MMKNIWILGLIMMATMMNVGDVEGAFSSTYVPSNFFEKVRIDGVLPVGVETSWDKININHSYYIIENESVWYKHNNKTGDQIGITFVSFRDDALVLINEFKSEFARNGAKNISVNQFDVPTIEMDYTGYTFKIHLQNSGSEPVRYVILITKGEEFVSNKLLDEYVVPANTGSDKFPVELKLIVPEGMSIGEFKDFSFTVADIKEKSTDGSIIPSTPFIKNYKILVSDINKPTGLEIFLPATDSVFRKSFFGKNELLVSWNNVVEPNFKHYEITVSDISKITTETFINEEINKTIGFVDFKDKKYGTYQVRVKALDKYGNYDERISEFTYARPNYVYVVLAIVCLLGIAGFGFWLKIKDKSEDNESES